MVCDLSGFRAWKFCRKYYNLFIISLDVSLQIMSTSTMHALFWIA